MDIDDEHTFKVLGDLEGKGEVMLILD